MGFDQPGHKGFPFSIDNRGLGGVYLSDSLNQVAFNQYILPFDQLFAFTVEDVDILDQDLCRRLFFLLLGLSLRNRQRQDQSRDYHNCVKQIFLFHFSASFNASAISVVTIFLIISLFIFAADMGSHASRKPAGQVLRSQGEPWDLGVHASMNPLIYLLNLQQ